MSDLKLCAFVPGRSIGWLMAKRLLPATGVSGFASAVTTVLTGGTGGVLIGALGALGQAVYVSNFVFSVDEFSYAVVSRADKVLKETRGSGLHEGVIGDEYHIISMNPISVKISVERSLKGGGVATVKLEVTFRPHPRLANADGSNTYGAWVVEGRRKKDAHYVSHQVDHAIERPLSATLSTILGHTSVEDLDAMQGALAVLIESEVSLNKPIHRSPEHRAKLVEIDPSVPDEEPVPGQLLAWYHKRERACREYLRRLDDEFDNSPYSVIEPGTVSHHELHVGGIFQSAEVVGVAYDAETLALLRAKKVATANAEAAKETMRIVKEAAADAAAVGGDPRVAQGIAGAAAKVPGVTVTVISSNDPNIAAAAAAGREVGKGMGGGK